MQREHVQPFFSEAVENYRFFAVDRVAEGLVVTLEYLMSPRPFVTARTVLIPNGARYRHIDFQGCVVFKIGRFDLHGMPREDAKWFHQAIFAPSQREYRTLVLDVWQKLARYGIEIIDAISVPAGLLATVRGTDRSRATLLEVNFSRSNVDSESSHRVITEFEVSNRCMNSRGAVEYDVTSSMYQYAAALLKSSSNAYMHVPTYRFGPCALEERMTSNEQTDLIELIHLSTAINRLDCSNRYCNRTVLDLAVEEHQDNVPVIRALLEQGAEVTSCTDPFTGVIAEIVQRKNLGVLQLFLEYGLPEALDSWWKSHGVQLCEQHRFSQGADLARTFLARGAAVDALKEICSDLVSEAPV